MGWGKEDGEGWRQYINGDHRHSGVRARRRSQSVFWLDTSRGVSKEEKTVWGKIKEKETEGRRIEPNP